MSDAPARTYREVVVATSNPGKLIEIRAILADIPLSFRALGAFPEVQLPEEGDCYEENARAKAQAVARGAGRPALGDDSGIEVVGLGGAPGPYSARYGGSGLGDAERTAKLLEALAGLEGDARRARFVCVAALATPEGDVVVAHGECRGRILQAPRGGGGFGYDPVFEVGDTGRAMAELPPEEKNRLSHRARAFSALRASLLDLVG
jgi:XTP/dITP diphosphohydrolase